ncbi:arylsulfatase [Niabella aurantiaca]|uniref:arylsulfatase n=1 Tax=Niabella aurantiaca TaxID=379900 RepID=UPI0003700793|nr:arylsulfatase [Niabella aurantiaca]
MFRLFLLFHLFFFAAGEANAQYPNVLLILTDDQGWGDFSGSGNPVLTTPHIDQLKETGASFTNFYVSPLCAPTRASLLTGRHHLRTGVASVSNGLEIMNTGENTLAELFASNGYRTACFGKWHNGSHYPNDPNGQGFQEFFGFCAGHWSNYFNTRYQHNQDFETDSGYITDVLTDRALQFMQKAGRPFFCYLAYNAPHTPVQVPDRYFKRYKEKGLSDELAGIYGMCASVDDNIGRITHMLKKTGLDKNTIVIFLSDNGPNGHRYNGILRDIKGSVYEGGIKVPCFVTWKGHIKGGLQVADLSQHIDLFPTLRDLCRLKINSDSSIDGISRAGLLSGKKISENRNIYSWVLSRSSGRHDSTLSKATGSVRNNTYALIYKKNGTELYDLVKDPSQKEEISRQFPQITETLKKDYLAWFRDCSKNFNMQRPVPLYGDRVELPAYEAVFSGGPKYKEGHGWAHDWLTNWGTGMDTISWKVIANTEKSFSVLIDYAVSGSPNGTEIALQIDDSAILTHSLCTICNPPFIASPDRVKRKEVYERQWCQLQWGAIKIAPGPHKVSLITRKPDAGITADFRALILKTPQVKIAATCYPGPLKRFSAASPLKSSPPELHKRRPVSLMF